MNNSGHMSERAKIGDLGLNSSYSYTIPPMENEIQKQIKMENMDVIKLEKDIMTQKNNARSEKVNTIIKAALKAKELGN